MLLISVFNKGRGIEITVRDNGIGRKAAHELHTEGAGIGLKNINSIVEMMNKANAEKIIIDITDLIEGDQSSGTEVRVFLPFNYSFDTQYFTHQ